MDKTVMGMRTDEIGINADKKSSRRYSSEDEMLADMKRQVTDIFYGSIRDFFTIMKEKFPRMQPEHPMVKALKTVIAADDVGRLEDHIVFDGQSVTHMSADGNTVLSMYADFQTMLNKYQRKAESVQ